MVFYLVDHYCCMILVPIIVYPSCLDSIPTLTYKSTSLPMPNVVFGLLSIDYLSPLMLSPLMLSKVVLNLLPGDKERVVKVLGM